MLPLPLNIFEITGEGDGILIRVVNWVLLSLLVTSCVNKQQINQAEGRPTVEIGEVGYRQHCINCHGPEGKDGGEMVSHDLIKSPKLFAGEVFNPVVLKGIKGTSMRSFASIVSPIQVESIRLYLVALREGTYERK